MLTDTKYFYRYVSMLGFNVYAMNCQSCILHVYCIFTEKLLFTARMVTFSNNVEPANGFLVRYLHRKMIESENERSLTNEDLMKVLDWVPKLWYHLHTFLEKHSTSDFLIGTEKNSKVFYCENIFIHLTRVYY